MPAGNRGQLVKIAPLEFGGNEPVHQSWCFFKTRALYLCNKPAIEAWGNQGFIAYNRSLVQRVEIIKVMNKGVYI